MKRTVAIYGPTPQFVRWTILHECPLREPVTENVPDVTFRQLRGLREFSVGVIEGRVFEDYCVHPLASAANIKQVRGFHADEVLDAHGDAEFVENCCGSCPANAVGENRPGVWAGCYGWLPAISGFSLGSTSTNEGDSDSPGMREADLRGRLDYVKLIEEAIEVGSTEAEEGLFLQTTPRWYGLWKTAMLSFDQVKFLKIVFDNVVSSCQRQRTAQADMVDLIQFRDALDRCQKHQLSMLVELVPPGNSDGQTWTLSAHCPDCKMAMQRTEPQKCGACGRYGSPHGQRKSKVLGLRPYVNLIGVKGEIATAEFMRRFDSRSSDQRDD